MKWILNKDYWMNNWENIDNILNRIKKKKNYNIWKYEIKNENYNIWKYKMKNEIYWMKI